MYIIQNLLYPQTKVGDILDSGPLRRRRRNFLVYAITQKRINIFFFISRPARRREIIICTMCVCTCVRACVRACVTQFSLKLLQLHIFGKSQVLMNFFALQYFWGLVNFGLLFSE